MAHVLFVMKKTLTLEKNQTTWLYFVRNFSSRLLCLTYGQKDLTKSIWEKATKLEKERKRRIEHSRRWRHFFKCYVIETLSLHFTNNIVHLHGFVFNWSWTYWNWDGEELLFQFYCLFAESVVLLPLLQIIITSDKYKFDWRRIIQYSIFILERKMSGLI